MEDGAFKKEYVESELDQIVLKNRLTGDLDSLRYDLNQKVIEVQKLAWEARETDIQYVKDSAPNVELIMQKMREAYDDSFDIYEGHEWLEKAVSYNHVPSMVLIGKYNIDAKGAEERKYARELLWRAASLGSQEAEQILRAHS